MRKRRSLKTQEFAQTLSLLPLRKSRHIDGVDVALVAPRSARPRNAALQECSFRPRTYPASQSAPYPPCNMHADAVSYKPPAIALAHTRKLAGNAVSVPVA